MSVVGLDGKMNFIDCEGKLHKMFSRVGLRHMDFLNIPEMLRRSDATARHSPSGLGSGFSEHPCSEIAVF